MTLSVAEQHKRIQEFNQKITERNALLNKMLAVCDTPKTADQIASALNLVGNSLSQNIALLVHRKYLKPCGLVLNEKSRKRTQYVAIRYDFNEDYKKETCSLIESNPDNPHMRIVRGSDHIQWTRCAPKKREVRIGSTMGMLS